MRWRSKNKDLKIISGFLQDLKEFQRLKFDRWEKIDEEVQMSIVPGTPSEDWIIPPDEDNTRKILEKDRDYVKLRKALSDRLPEIKKCAKFLHFDAHHDFDWVTFTTPLIGNAALEDAISDAEELRACCEKRIYIWKNVQAIIS